MTMLEQRMQYIRDCTKISQVLSLQAAYKKIYGSLPQELAAVIEEKLISFKIEDENEII